MYTSQWYSVNLSHSLLPLCPKSVLYVCIFIPSLQIGSSVPFFLDKYFCAYNFSLSLNVSGQNDQLNIWNTPVQRAYSNPISTQSSAWKAKSAEHRKITERGINACCMTFKYSWKKQNLISSFHKPMSPASPTHIFTTKLNSCSNPPSPSHLIPSIEACVIIS